MKRYIIVLFVVLKFNNLFCQVSSLDGVYISPMIGTESIIYEFRNDTFIYTSGDFIECGILGETLQGLYKIKKDKIYFEPLSPKNFQRSIINYQKEEYWQKRYDFKIYTLNLKNDSMVSEIEVKVYDSVDLKFPFLSLSSFDGNLCFSIDGSISIKKIEMISCGYETVTLDFDPTFLGRHNYSIRLAEVSKYYIYRSPYSWDILDIKPKFIRVKFNDRIWLMVKKEYATEVFLNTGVFIE